MVFALVKMQMHLAGMVFVFDNRCLRAASRDPLARLRVQTLVREPVAIIVHRIVHGAARLADHATQGQVLEGCAETATRMPFHVREIDEERRVLNHPGNSPL